MPEPIEFRIVQNLQTALRAIATAAGFHYDVQTIAVKLDPNSAIEAVKSPGGPRPLVLLQVNPERRQYEPGNQLKVIRPITIHWVNESTATDDDSRMQTFFRGCADVEQAIAADVSRGGLAVDTRIVRQVFEDSVDGSQVWAQIEVDVQLHRTYGLPNG